MKIGAAYIDKNGNLVFKSLSDACDISELTYRGYEQLIKQINTSTGLILGEFQIIPFSEKILYADNDGDGIPNKDDPYPDEAFDERFEIISDYSYEPSIDFVDERYKNSQKCYSIFDKLTFPNDNSIHDPMYYGKLIGAYFSILSMDNFLISDEIISEIFGFGYDMDFGLHPERSENSSAMNHAGLALCNYFANSGIQMNYNEVDTCELLACSKNNLDHLHRNISRVTLCSEQILCDNQSLSIASKSNSNFKATCNVNRGANDGGVDCDITNDDGRSYHIGDIQCNYVHRDW